jgi:large subunit ribosomal protein L2
MAIKSFKPEDARLAATVNRGSNDLSKKKPEKSAHEHQTSTGGRNHNGRITSRFRGGGHKQRYRLIDWKRDRVGIPATVAAIEYDPNRTARIALLHYVDGVKAYILAPDGLKAGDAVVSSATRTSSRATRSRCASSRSARCAQRRAQDRQGRPARALGGLGRAGHRQGRRVGPGPPALGRDPQGPPRLPRHHRSGLNPDHANVTIGKAGRTRWLGKRPHNRGVSMNPVDHPMGGGEGRTSGGRHPCSPWGSSPRARRPVTTSAPTAMIIKRRGAKG